MFKYVSRTFARLYNEQKVKLKKHEIIQQKERMKFAQSSVIQTQIQSKIQEIKKSLGFQKLSQAVQANRMQLKKMKGPRFVSQYDPQLNKQLGRGIRKNLNVAVQKTKEATRMDLFVEDQSQESIRNKLLTQETEEILKEYRKIQEMDRKAKLLQQSPKYLLREKYTGDIDVDAKINQYLQEPAQQSTSLIPAKIETEIISTKGVVDLTKRGQSKTVKWSHLKNQEINNYIAYNVQEMDQLIQVYENCSQLEQFDENSRAF